MVDHDAPLKRARSQLSIGTLDGLLRGLWNKLATVGASPLLQDESGLSSPCRGSTPWASLNIRGTKFADS